MQDIINAIDDILSDTETSRQFINRADRIRTKSVAALESANRELKNLDSPLRSKIAFDTAIEQVKEKAPDIYKEEVEDAVIINDEYAFPAFLTSLLDVANDSNLYSITPAGTGWSRTISVVLEMDMVAGDISDYASAVEAAREEMGVGKTDPDKASKIWKDKIYPTRGSRGTYSHTISTRMALVGSTAPFWSLLDSGNKNGMPSDRGGTAYPSRSGTRFVDKTEARIKKMFTSLMRDYKRADDDRKDILKTSIQELKSKVKQLDLLIDELENNFEYAKQVIRRLGRTLDEVDPDKLLSVLDQIRSGNLSSDRPNIGVRGYRLRVSASRLAGVDY